MSSTWTQGAATSVGAWARAGVIGALLLGGAGCGEGDARARVDAAPSRDEVECGHRDIVHRYGSTTLAGAPDRIVSLSYRDQDAAIALGTVPVAVQDGYYQVPYLEWPWVEDRLAGARPRVLAEGEVNFEEVAALGPDAVLGAASGVTAGEYRLLSQIAPTIAPSGEYVDFGVPWQEALRVTGRVLCREDAADARISELEERLEMVRDRHPALADATALVAMAGGPGGAYWAFGPQDTRSRFLASLGLRIPKPITALAGDRFVATVSAERVDLLNADVLLWIARPEQRQALEANPLYARLNAVREGRVLYLEPDGLLTAAMTNTTALSLPYLLDELVPRIAAVLGDQGRED